MILLYLLILQADCLCSHRRSLGDLRPLINQDGRTQREVTSYDPELKLYTEYTAPDTS